MALGLLKENCWWPPTVADTIEMLPTHMQEQFEPQNTGVKLEGFSADLATKGQG